MNLDKNKTKLLLGKPIPFENSLIHQPTIDEIDELTDEVLTTIFNKKGK